SEPVLDVLRKYDVPFSLIGRVTDDGNLTLKWRGTVVANLPAQLVVKAPLIPWPARKPAAPDGQPGRAPATQEAGRSILSLLASPNISSRRWVYRQYDHEVGVRTVI